MILHQSICDECGNITEINKGCKSFQIVLKSYPLGDHSFNDTFGNQWSSAGPKKTIASDGQVDWINSTFCDSECFIEYLKNKMTNNGLLQLSKEELQQLEDDQPKEIKELKKVAKALRDLEEKANSVGGAHNAKSTK